MSTLEEITIAMSHEDFDTWSTLTVGFNYTKSLVICLTFYDYKNVQHHTYAIMCAAVEYEIQYIFEKFFYMGRHKYIRRVAAMFAYGLG